MADITLNFSSQWPSIQVAKVIASPETNASGETVAYPYVKRYKHNLGYPPFAVGMGVASGATSYNPMVGLDVDETYVYINAVTTGWPALQCAVVYALDISKPYTYPNKQSALGDVATDTSGGTLDLRKFLLHSRAVSPMVYAVTTKDYTPSDLTLTYTHDLGYPIFNFGYVRWAYNGGAGSIPVGVWRNAPLASQAFPWLNTNGTTSTLGSTTISGGVAADKGSIITLRNPAIITSNTVNVSI